jgi:hypothetical protein
MAHVAPPSAYLRRRERLFGLVLLLIGTFLALLAISALSHSKLRPAGLRPASLRPASGGPYQPSSTGGSESGLDTALSPTARPTAAG